MVMGGDSYSEGHGFEFQNGILDVHFHIYLLSNNFNVGLKRRK